ncbi:hypothetical protein RUND412_009177 [Rhizina undulata]
MSNVSDDLIWAITRDNSSYIVKRGYAGSRVTFSKEPLNLTNKHSRKYSGLANEKAIGVQANEKGGITFITKKSAEKHANKPATLYNTVEFGKNKTNRKSYAAIVNSTAKHYYRNVSLPHIPDILRLTALQEAVARASAIKRSQRPVKPTREQKPRGVKAKKAAAGKA